LSTALASMVDCGTNENRNRSRFSNLSLLRGFGRKFRFLRRSSPTPGRGDGAPPLQAWEEFSTILPHKDGKHAVPNDEQMMANRQNPLRRFSGKALPINSGAENKKRELTTAALFVSNNQTKELTTADLFVFDNQTKESTTTDVVAFEKELTTADLFVTTNQTTELTNEGVCVFEKEFTVADTFIVEHQKKELTTSDLSVCRPCRSQQIGAFV